MKMIPSTLAIRCGDKPRSAVNFLSNGMVAMDASDC